MGFWFGCPGDFGRGESKTLKILLIDNRDLHFKKNTLHCGKLIQCIVGDRLGRFGSYSGEIMVALVKDHGSESYFGD